MRRILWGRATSSNVMKVIWLMEELAIPYERIDVGGSFGRTDTAEYRAMNPTGLVPTLQEDGFTLFESNAILRHLAADSSLFPAEKRARAEVDCWMDAQQTVMVRPQSTIFVGLIRTEPEKRDHVAIAAAIPEAARAWGLIGDRLGRHPYICGEVLTLADMAWGVHVHRWLNMEFNRPEVANLKAWYERLLARPAYREHVARAIV